MAVGSSAGGAQVLAFPTNRLSQRDRAAALCWIEGPAAAGYGEVRFHEREPGDAPEFHDFALIYRQDEPWAVWGIARSGLAMLAWNCASGATLGIFRSMGDALEALPPAGQPQQATRRCARRAGAAADILPAAG